MRKVMLSILTASGLIAAGCPPTNLPDSAPDTMLQKEGWVLKIWITHKGTRSEGHFSVLIHNGKIICPDGNRSIIETPLGRLKYREGRYLWRWKGWKPVKEPSTTRRKDWRSTS
jgi:hypothetical protein